MQNVLQEKKPMTRRTLPNAKTIFRMKSFTTLLDYSEDKNDYLNVLHKIVLSRLQRKGLIRFQHILKC